MKAEEIRFEIVGSKLLGALRATLPLASKDDERGHLMQVRFNVERDVVEISATDGHALARVIAQLDSADAPVSFGLHTTFAPTIIKALARVDGENLKNLAVEFSVGTHRVRVRIGDTTVVVPNVSEQLSFPEIERIIPRQHEATRTTVTTFGVGPALMKRVMGAAAHISATLVWSSPASPTDPIRFDAVDGIGGLAGTFVVMPMRLSVYEPSEDGDAGENGDTQTIVPGTERAPGEVA